MLSCPISGAGIAHGDWCCRLAGFHSSTSVRVRRNPSDATDAQWQEFDPLLPDPASLGGQVGDTLGWDHRFAIG